MQKIQTTYNFRKFKTIQSFGEAIRNDIVTMDLANDEQQQLAKKFHHENIH